MILSIAAKQEYVDLIDKIWQGSMNSNSLENITEEIADEMKFILSEIKNCTENIDNLLEALVIAFPEIYSSHVGWRYLIEELSGNPSKKGYVKNWIVTLRGNGAHLACVVTAAVNWKSSIQMKLMGL